MSSTTSCTSSKYRSSESGFPSNEGALRLPRKGYALGIFRGGEEFVSEPFSESEGGDDSDKELSVGRVVEDSSPNELSVDRVLLEGTSCSSEAASLPCSCTDKSVSLSGNALSSDSESWDSLGILVMISGTSSEVDPGSFLVSSTSLSTLRCALVCFVRFFPSVKGVMGFGGTETRVDLLAPGGRSS